MNVDSPLLLSLHLSPVRLHSSCSIFGATGPEWQQDLEPHVPSAQAAPRASLSDPASLWRRVCLDAQISRAVASGSLSLICSAWARARVQRSVSGVSMPMIRVGRIESPPESRAQRLCRPSVGEAVVVVVFPRPPLSRTSDGPRACSTSSLIGVVVTRCFQGVRVFCSGWFAIVNEISGGLTMPLVPALSRRWPASGPSASSRFVENKSAGDQPAP